MKFFEFNSADFEYYALIGAVSIEEAIKYYVENINEINSEVEPLEISKSEAKKKLIHSCECSEEANSVKKKFNKFTLMTGPYLILCDVSLF